MTATASAWTVIPTAVVVSIRESPFRSHHEMRCDHGTTEMHTDPRDLTTEDAAALVMGHQAQTACNCGTQWALVTMAGPVQ